MHFEAMFSHRGDGIPTQPCCDEETRDAAQVLMAAATRTAELTEKLGEALDALGQVRQWAESYPIDIFPEPDLDAVKAALDAAGIANHMDRMHASWARYLTRGIGNIADAALSQLEDKR